MSAHEKLDRITGLVNTIRDDLRFEYERTTLSNVYASIGGMDQEFQGVEVEVKLTIEDLADDTISNALEEIDEVVEELRLLAGAISETPPVAEWREYDSDMLLRALGEQVKSERSARMKGSYAYSLWPAAFSDLLESLPGIAYRFARPTPETVPPPAMAITTGTVEETAEDPRSPWPGLRGNGPQAAEYPRLYHPPPGFDWTGEFRQPLRGEWFVSKTGSATHATTPREGITRPILRQLSEGELPPVADTPPAPPASPAQPESFEPPKVPDPV